ncbi:hypothetical protein CJ030_MR4G013715 [Morella rubra]|uniref:Uncharacterized protein n=1 Tax=Morella rubra TaxID=262757 RepID=A0A6A1WTU8_9ROSI|nr:hypothetical protein CJ030_MR4G013715 [Morella rubra]
MTWFRNEVEGTTLDISQDFPTKRFTIPEPPLGDTVKLWFLKDLGEKWKELQIIEVKLGNKVDHSKHRSTLQDLRALHVMLRSWRMEEIELNDSASSQTLSQSRMGGTSVGHHLTDMHKSNVFDFASNQHQFFELISCKPENEFADNVDDAESAGADGAEGGED